MIMSIISSIFWLNYYLFFNLKFFIFYSLLNLLCSYWLYSNMSKYYKKIIVTTEDGKQIELNDLYPEFKRYESRKSFTFLRIFAGFYFLVWWRVWVFFLCCVFYSLSLR